MTQLKKKTEVQDLAKFVTTRNFTDLSQDAIRELKIRLLDSLGCAIGALPGEPIKKLKLFIKSTSVTKQKINFK